MRAPPRGRKIMGHAVPHNGEVVEFTSAGEFMSAPRQRYQALCELLNTYERVEQYSNLVGWPIKQDDTKWVTGKTKPGTMMIPPEYQRRSWFLQVTDGVGDVDPKWIALMKKRLDREWELERIETAQGAAKVARHLQKRALAGELSSNDNVLYKYGHDAAGFTYSSYKETAANQTIQVGKLNINAGQRPPRKGELTAGHKKTRKKLTEGVINAEFREVPP